MTVRLGKCDNTIQIKGLEVNASPTPTYRGVW